MATIIKTIQASGGDYSLLSECMTLEATDLVAAGDSLVVRCFDDWPGGVTDHIKVQGFVTDASNNITIEAEIGSENNGIPETGYYAKRTANFGHVIEVHQDYTTLKSLTFRNNNNGGSGAYIASGTDGVVIDSCIASSGKNGSNNSSGSFRIAGTSTISPKFHNCLGHDGRNGLSGAAAAGGVDIEGCTFVNNVRNGCSVDFNNVNGVHQVKNTVMYNNGIKDYNETGNVSPTELGIATGDTSAVGAGAITGIVDGDFEDFANSVFVPSVGGALENIGFTTSLTVDCRGVPRNAPPEIGAYEIPEQGGVPPSNLQVDGPWVAEKNVPTVVTGSYTPGSGIVHTIRWTTTGSGSFTDTADPLAPLYTATVAEVATLGFYVDADDTPEVGPATSTFTSTDALTVVTSYWVQPAFGDDEYSTIDDWWAAITDDLVSANEEHILLFKVDGLQIANLTLGGKVTSEINKITIKPFDDTVWHKGDINNGLLVSGSTTNGVFRVQVDYLTVEGVRFKNDVGPAIRVEGDHITVRQCMLTQGTYGILQVNGYTDMRVENCTGTNIGTFIFSGGAANNRIANCTSKVNGSLDYGMSATNTQFPAPQYQNVAVYGSLTQDFRTGYDDNATHNASGDTSAPGGSSITGISDADFVNPAVNDFSITDTSALAGVGVEMDEFTEDIRGDTRTRPWDMGAYKVAALTIGSMHVKGSGGAWVAAKPNLKIGGAWQEVDSYVLSGGVWVQVHGI